MLETRELLLYRLPKWPFAVVDRGGYVPCRITEPPSPGHVFVSREGAWMPHPTYWKIGGYGAVHEYTTIRFRGCQFSVNVGELLLTASGSFKPPGHTVGYAGKVRCNSLNHLRWVKRRRKLSYGQSQEEEASYVKKLQAWGIDRANFKPLIESFAWAFDDGWQAEN